MLTKRVYIDGKCYHISHTWILWPKYMCIILYRCFMIFHVKYTFQCGEDTWRYWDSAWMMCQARLARLFCTSRCRDAYCIHHWMCFQMFSGCQACNLYQSCWFVCGREWLWGFIVMDRRARIIVVACLDSGCAPVAIGARVLQMSAFIDSLIVSQCIISFWHPRLKVGK